MIPITFEEWKDCIVNDCHIKLTKEFATSRLKVYVADTKMLNATQSIAISEGLNFQPGVRVETNCQNCGFTQVRLNGLEGAYSQILINSRPIF